MSISQVTQAWVGHWNQSKPEWMVDMGLGAALDLGPKRTQAGLQNRAGLVHRLDGASPANLSSNSSTPQGWTPDQGLGSIPYQGNFQANLRAWAEVTRGLKAVCFHHSNSRCVSLQITPSSSPNQIPHLALASHPNSQLLLPNTGILPPFR